ncbi:MAG TPA: protein-glutamate O-methyltransferase [Steroidobacteraceae bacterium]|nr:protein-glutamate O-methyltransferase [Steroidobacteraceae bacterium]
MQNLAPNVRLQLDSSFTAVLGDREFDFIRLVIEQNAGIILGPNKRQLVQGRLVRRLRELGLPSYEAYCEHIRESGPEELVGLINALTTNVTSFFREKHHFDALTSYMLPEAMKRNATSRRLRIWSAGCSSGEEPYSIAISALQAVPAALRWDLKILATDIDSEMIAFARRGYYPEDRVAALVDTQLRAGFLRRDDVSEVRVKPEIASCVRFAPLNLLHDWPMKGPFDVIFCRNVMIYFDQVTRERLVQRFADYLAPEGYLCLGHSESIHGPHAHFKLVGRTIYRRVAGGTRGA